MRNVKIPDEYNIEKAADRMITKFAQSHRKIVLSDAGKKAFASYAAYFNIAVHQAREQEDVDSGATYGACQWKLAMLSAALLLWDIQWGQAAVDPPADDSELEIPKSTVDRAFGLLELLNSIEAMMAEKVKEGTSWYSKTNNVGGAASASNADFNYDPAAQATGLKDSEFARRLLFRLTPFPNHVSAEANLKNKYVMEKGDVYKIVTAK